MKIEQTSTRAASHSCVRTRGRDRNVKTRQSQDKNTQCYRSFLSEYIQIGCTPSGFQAVVRSIRQTWVGVVLQTFDWHSTRVTLFQVCKLTCAKGRDAARLSGNEGGDKGGVRFRRLLLWQLYSKRVHQYSYVKRASIRVSLGCRSTRRYFSHVCQCEPPKTNTGSKATSWIQAFVATDGLLANVYTANTIE